MIYLLNALLIVNGFLALLNLKLNEPAFAVFNMVVCAALVITIFELSDDDNSSNNSNPDDKSGPNDSL